MPLYAHVLIQTKAPAAYTAPRIFGVLNLSSKSTLQVIAHSADVCSSVNVCLVCVNYCVLTGRCFYVWIRRHGRCHSQAVWLVLCFQERMDKGLQEPKRWGVLVFNEVKVISHLMWNSKSQKMIGLAMTPEEMSSLHDIFMSHNEDTKTAHILHLTISLEGLDFTFDIIGPYFTSSKTSKVKHILVMCTRP